MDIFLSQSRIHFSEHEQSLLIFLNVNKLNTNKFVNSLIVHIIDLVNTFLKKKILCVFQIDKKLMQTEGMVTRVRKEVEIHSRLKQPSILEVSLQIVSQVILFQVIRQNPETICLPKSKKWISNSTITNQCGFRASMNPTSYIFGFPDFANKRLIYISRYLGK